MHQMLLFELKALEKDILQDVFVHRPTAIIALCSVSVRYIFFLTHNKK